jgi:hypothetical protein
LTFFSTGKKQSPSVGSFVMKPCRTPYLKVALR